MRTKYWIKVIAMDDEFRLFWYTKKERDSIFDWLSKNLTDGGFVTIGNVILPTSEIRSIQKRKVIP